MRRWASGHSDSIEGIGRIIDSGPQRLVSVVARLWTPIGEGVPSLSSSDGSVHVGVDGDSSTGGLIPARVP